MYEGIDHKHRDTDQCYKDHHVSPFLSQESHACPCYCVQEKGDSPNASTIDPGSDIETLSDSGTIESPDESDDSDLYRTDMCSPCYGLVHKLLKRKEWDQDALQAIKDEASALLGENTWLPETVIEKSELIKRARAENKRIHCGELMSICSIKHWESPTKRKHKGRIVFRGDCVKDEFNAAAVFQELSASPTTIHSANSAIAYGCIPGHSVSQADAVRAYVQSELKSKHETWVVIPRELWPKDWSHMIKPMCQLRKALYGHPESGGHWEKHLETAIKGMGGKPVENHPSSYWFEGAKLLLTVYVDDLLLSGPTENHENFWYQLRYGSNPIKLEDPEKLSRFLGREHVPV